MDAFESLFSSDDVDELRETAALAAIEHNLVDAGVAAATAAEELGRDFDAYTFAFTLIYGYADDNDHEPGRIVEWFESRQLFDRVAERIRTEVAS
jgi:hypothetical protein